jgi:hypothetical protein
MFNYLTRAEDITLTPHLMCGNVKEICHGGRLLCGAFVVEPWGCATPPYAGASQGGEHIVYSNLKKRD